MGQAQQAHHARCNDGPTALGPTYRYFVPREFPECAAKTRPGSGNLNPSFGRVVGASACGASVAGSARKRSDLVAMISTASTNQIETWGDRVLDATSLEAVFGAD